MSDKKPHKMYLMKRPKYPRYGYSFSCQYMIDDATESYIKEVREWCCNSFDNGRRTWLYSNPDMFHFKREQDAFAFRMRWC